MFEKGDQKMSFFKEWFKFIIAFLAPLVVIMIGCTLAGFGITSENTTLVAIGLFATGAGVFWGIFQFHNHF